MKLFKSIFWLTIGFLAIGPQVNAVETVNELSRQTISGGERLVAGQVDQIACTDLVCLGGKLAAGRALSLVQDPLERPESHSTEIGDIPFPRPRLDRT